MNIVASSARILISLGLAGSLIEIYGCAASRHRDGVATGQESTTPNLRGERLKSWGLVTASGARVDPGSGLPTRVLHEASGIALLLVPPGEFFMGVDGGQGPEARHLRYVKHHYYLGETEVTFGQFLQFVRQTGYITDAESGTAPEEPDKVRGAFASQADRVHQREWSAIANWMHPFPLVVRHAVRDDHPVSQVSWNDAMAFCRHFGVQLPTDAQWEYAYRAGADTRYPWGDDGAAGAVYMNGGDLSMARLFDHESPAYDFDDGHPTHAPVASFRPNAWGFYDMAGNVEEWTSNDFALPAPVDGADESAPAPSSSVRALRGSTWFSSPEASGPWERFSMRPTSRRDFIGFRVAINLDSARE